MPRFRSLLLTTCVVLSAQACVIWLLGGRPVGAILSETLQFVFGLICLWLLARSIPSSGCASRYCGLSLAASIGLCTLAQGLGIYIDLASPPYLEFLDNVLFFSSGIPIAMLLFIDADKEHDPFDRLHLLDFIQVCAFWICVYRYFSGTPVAAVARLGSTPLGWNTSVVFDGVLALSFVLRAALGGNNAVRRLFGLMALYLVAAGLADSYAELAANHIEDGMWFDLVWNALLVAPLFIGAIWHQSGRSAVGNSSRTQRIVANQFFPLVYPFCSLLLITRIAERERFLSSCIVVVIFAAVAIRVLVIQHRLLKAQETLSFDATHDSLTSLPNRCEILRRLESELERQKRTGESFGVILVDVDHFKKINDTFGHGIGDEVLRELGKRFVASLRPYDSVGRYGGEEFLIVIPGCNAQEALMTAKRLRQNVELPLTFTSVGNLPVTVSVGLITSTGAARSVDSLLLLRMADEALYRAKAKGRNRVDSAIFWGGESIEHAGMSVGELHGERDLDANRAAQ